MLAIGLLHCVTNYYSMYCSLVQLTFDIQMEGIRLDDYNIIQLTIQN